MKIKLGNLLGLIPKEADREEFLRLRQQYNEASNVPEAKEAGGAASPSDSQREQILDQIMKRIQWHFRAIRYPLPTRQDVEEMLKEPLE